MRIWDGVGLGYIVRVLCIMEYLSGGRVPLSIVEIRFFELPYFVIYYFV